MQIREDENHLLDYWQDYHAQLVMTGNTCCRTRQPRCAGCPLKPLLPAARGPLRGDGLPY